MRHKRWLRDEDERLSMTPMIDVTFLLLLFFLCTLQFKRLEGKIPALLPRAGAGDAPSVREDVQITLRVEGGAEARTVRFRAVGRDYADLDALLRRLRRIPRESVPGIRIRCGDGVLYGDVVGLLDALLLEDWTDIGFVPTRRK